jgi:hypothetical protein
MKIYNHIVGNIADPKWSALCRKSDIDYIDLDQWTAQKSRFVVRGRGGKEYAIALKRHTQLQDGDILHYDEASSQMMAVWEVCRVVNGAIIWRQVPPRGAPSAPSATVLSSLSAPTADRFSTRARRAPRPRRG